MPLGKIVKGLKGAGAVSKATAKSIFGSNRFRRRKLPTPSDFRLGPRKVPTPSVKFSPFGTKVADSIPDRVPKNWTEDDIIDAITDYRASIYVRKLEQTAYDLADEGSQLERLRHARRIAQEEAFLAKLMKALGKSLDKYKCK